MAAGVGLATLARGRVVETPAPALTLSLLPPANATFTPFGTVGTPHFALSPDGRRIASVVSRPGRPPSVWIRSLDSTFFQELPGTDDASSPFWSPDGETVGFFARGKLKRIGLRDGRPEDVANVPDGREGGGAWSSTGVILFHHSSGPLSRIRASGGPVETATLASKQTPLLQHRWPQFLPDGRHFLYSDRQTGATYLGDLDSSEVTEIHATGEQRAIFKGGTAVYAPPGFLLFPRAGKLWAQALDSKTWNPVGDPSSVVDQVGYAGGSGTHRSQHRPTDCSRIGMARPSMGNYSGLTEAESRFRRVGHRSPLQARLASRPTAKKLRSHGAATSGSSILAARHSDSASPVVRGRSGRLMGCVSCSGRANSWWSGLSVERRRIDRSETSCRCRMFLRTGRLKADWWCCTHLDLRPDGTSERCPPRQARAHRCSNRRRTRSKVASHLMAAGSPMSPTKRDNGRSTCSRSR